ncbi:MAG: hypothetical protein HOO06_10020 [Bdellovibrionaceae bacterium]|nr:hypothetical protein [Pseudobdellovibrionaceae bacterium]
MFSFKNSIWEIKQSFSNQNFGWIINICLLTVVYSLLFSINFHISPQASFCGSSKPCLGIQDIISTYGQWALQAAFIFSFMSLILFGIKKLFLAAISLLLIAFVLSFTVYLGYTSYQNHIFNAVFVFIFIFLFFPHKKKVLPYAIIIFLFTHLLGFFETSWLSGWALKDKISISYNLLEVIAYFYILVVATSLSLLFFNKNKYNVFGVLGLIFSMFFYLYIVDNYILIIPFTLLTCSLFFFIHEHQLIKTNQLYISFLNPEANQAWKYFSLALVIASQAIFIFPFYSQSTTNRLNFLSFKAIESKSYLCKQVSIITKGIHREVISQSITPFECLPLKQVFSSKSLCNKTKTKVSTHLEVMENKPSSKLLTFRSHDICSLQHLSMEDFNESI